MNSSKNWCFAIYNTTAQDCAGIQAAYEGGVIRYFVYTSRTGLMDIPCIKGLIVLYKKTRLAGVAKLVPRAQLEACCGSAATAADTYRLDCEYTEQGLRPRATSRLVADQSRWAAARKAAEDGRMEAIPADLYIRYAANLHLIRELALATSLATSVAPEPASLILAPEPDSLILATEPVHPLARFFASCTSTERC